MPAVWRTVLLAVAVVASSTGMQRQPDASLVLRAVRSYRVDHGRTQVDVFVQVPYALLEPTKEGAGSMLSYRMAVRVSDSTGLALLQQAWQNHAAPALDRPEAYGMEVIQFSLAPGSYYVDVNVEDSVSGRRASSRIDLEGFASAPPASDLLLSPQIRLAAASDSVPRPAELRWGRILVTAAARLQLTPLRPHAYYLLEAYSRQETSGTLELRVTDSAGKVMVRATPTPVHVDSGGGVIRGQLDLTGLPPGRYSMTAALNLGKDSVDRSASFVMSGLEETLGREVARREADRVTDEGYFAAMNGDSLDAAREPLVTIAQAGELASWTKSLSPRAKRNFLARFWSRRDPTPGTPRNEARDVFYQKVEYANTAYRETGRGTVAGWRSDRGRIFLRNGTPDDVLRQGAHGAGGRLASRALPYEVWHYASGKDRYYIFVDRSGSGAYSLVRSNDLKEVGLTNWNEFFGRDDLEQIEQFLGRDVFRETRAF